MRRGDVTSRPGPTTGLERRGSALTRAKVVSYKVIADGKRTPIIGSYLPPSTLGHLPDLEEARTRFWDQDPIVIGNLSADIVKSQNSRSQQVADLLMEFSMMELLLHFRQS